MYHLHPEDSYKLCNLHLLFLLLGEGRQQNAEHLIASYKYANKFNLHKVYVIQIIGMINNVRHLILLGLQLLCKHFLIFCMIV